MIATITERFDILRAVARGEITAEEANLLIGVQIELRLEEG